MSSEIILFKKSVIQKISRNMFPSNMDRHPHFEDKQIIYA